MISKKVKNFVFERADYICEYCLSLVSYSPQPFEAEHIIPSSKDGTDDIENLACACGGCNGIKYNKTDAIDPLMVKLFLYFTLVKCLGMNILHGRQILYML